MLLWQVARQLRRGVKQATMRFVGIASGLLAFVVLGPDERAVGFLKEKTPHHQRDASDDHRIIQASVDVAASRAQG